MSKKLTIAEQKQIVKDCFPKLKNKFLTAEQRERVHLRELSADYWLVYRPWSQGFTYYNYILKNSPMYVVIRYYSRHADLDELLDTIAHEFAHVYLNFTNPYHGEDEEHKKWTKYFYEFLLDKY